MYYNQEQKAKDILAIICNYSDIPEKEIKSPTRKDEVVIFRHLYIYFTRKLTSLPYRIIDEIVGRKSHCTAIRAIERINGYIEFQDKKIMQPYLELAEIFDVN